MRSFVFAALLLILTALAAAPSCSSVKKSATSVARTLRIIDDPATRVPAEAPPEFRAALAHLEKEEYAKALEWLEEFLRKEPTSPWTQAASLNVGRALEGLGRWSEAAERYRKVVTATVDVAPKIQAMALYRLSFTYEALGDDQQTVVVLVDLMNRDKYLPEEIARAELPARLAGAYARVGNFEKAVAYYKLAENGVQRLKQANLSRTVPAWYARTLYFMGNMSLRKVSWQDFETAIRPLARSQVYLLQAAELSVEPWAERASRDLIATYRDLWSVIENAPKPADGDPVIAAREAQQKQWERAALVLDCLRDLRARALPASIGKVGPPATEAMSFASDLEKKLLALLEERPVGEGPTKESAERKKGVRGRVVDPDDSLERKFLIDAQRKDPNL